MEWSDKKQKKQGENSVTTNVKRDNSVRNMEILRMLVDGYIQSDTPISSQYITQQPGVKLSSASIRSIFSHLEYKGYIFSPHRSAGRLPTPKAWQYYIDRLEGPSPYYIENSERIYIQNEYLRKNLNIDDVLSTTTRILSMLTRYATLIVGPSTYKAVLKHIELIDMGSNQLMVILVTRAGRVISRPIYIEEHIPQNILREISLQLNQSMQGLELKDLAKKVVATTQLEAKKNQDRRSYYVILANALEKHIDIIINEQTFYKEGFDSLYLYLNEETFRHLHEFIEKANFEHELWQKIQSSDLNICIAEEYDGGLQGISCISGGYKMGEKHIGSISIIGPMRMDYRRIISLVEYVRFILSNILTRLSN